ncbi:MAG: hypothetical protein AAF085_00770, partial [Planctomycetota bacterium]
PPIGRDTSTPSDVPILQVALVMTTTTLDRAPQSTTDIRDALDKTSGVSPVAAGVLRGKVGNLSSQNAVRLVLMGLLARVERKRVTYGSGLQRLCELVLHAADVYGVLPNSPDERRVRIDWPDPIPENQREQLELAQSKLDLGVPRQVVLNELGYGQLESNHAPNEKE